ncbi:unnamed protein product [Bursaphelenchus xylophilus]|uniref:(pine wood nematode) hypothetical protein n=1 Tax=Bursaphelenchus xylophilus TaxID=6326 RepID=A0A1I7SED6_BURXY|nr:unnamed protein product [Bursaphelenchus xylophilus]CAG9104078.1 unnamed protein product [Bursaphelenchus xylophilus]
MMMFEPEEISYADRVNIIFHRIKMEPLGPKRFDLAKNLIQIGYSYNLSDDIVVKCMNLCLIVQSNEERLEAESTLFSMIEMISKRKPRIFDDLPRFFEASLVDPKLAVEKAIICLRAISIDEAVLYPLRLRLVPFMKKALDKICSSLPIQRPFVAVSVMKILVGWQKRRNAMEKAKKGVDWEIACVVKDLVDKVVSNVDSTVKVKKEELVEDEDLKDIPTTYFEHIACILIRIGTTLHSVRRFGEPYKDQRATVSSDQPGRSWAPQLKSDIFHLLSTALARNFCRTDVRVKSDWFEYLIDQSKSLPDTAERSHAVSEFYYTLYFFVEMFSECRDQYVLMKIVRGVERILTNVFEHKIVTVYTTAFLLTSRIFGLSRSRSGLDAAPHLFQHVMSFFRHFFTKLADPQTNFDLSFLKQIRISTNFLATISKFQPNFIEGVSINFFVKAAEKIVHMFVRNVELNAENPRIFESPEYQNLLRSVTSIVRIITPCLYKASQEVCRNVSQSILMPAVPIVLPSHLVDRDLLHHLLVTLIPLLNGPAAPSYCVPLLHRLSTFRHLIFQQKESLQPIFKRIIRHINGSQTLRTTRLMAEVEPILVVEQFKRDLKRAYEIKKEMSQIQKTFSSKDGDRALREEMDDILKKHFAYTVPGYIHPQNLYEIPTLMALRAKLLEIATDATFDEVNELFLLAIHMVEEAKKQPKPVHQRIREEERKVFKYYSEYLEKNLAQAVRNVEDGSAVWNVDDVLNAANVTLVTARALRYANAKQGQVLMQRFLGSVHVMLTAQAATTCEISKWSNYISIALDEVPIEHWDPYVTQIILDLKRGTVPDFLHRVGHAVSFFRNKDRGK